MKPTSPTGSDDHPRREIVSMDAPVTDRRVLDLVDTHETPEALFRYCRGLDRLDAELINSAYHPDARENHNGLLIEGASAGETLVAKARDREVSRHCITNVLVRLDGDVADCESYWLALIVA